MHEVLPVAVGMLIGAGAKTLPKTGRRVVVAAPACLLAGAAVSAITGELTQGGWFVFVSVDSVLVWLGAAATLAGLRRNCPA